MRNNEWHDPICLVESQAVVLYLENVQLERGSQGKKKHVWNYNNGIIYVGNKVKIAVMMANIRNGLTPKENGNEENLRLSR